MCVSQGGGREGGGGIRADCPWCSPLRAGLNEVISRPQSICYRGSSSDQGVAMARWTQKGVAWERVQGSGVRVRGSKVTASWTAHKRRRGWEKKEGRFGFLSPFRPFFSRFLPGRETSDKWTPLDINIELGRWDEIGRGGLQRVKGSEKGHGVHREGPPKRPGSGRLACIRPRTYWCLIVHSIWQAIDCGQCSRKRIDRPKTAACVCVCLCVCVSVCVAAACTLARQVIWRGNKGHSTTFHYAHFNLRQ